MRFHEFITERKKKRKKSFRYGGYWYPGFAYGSTETGGEGGGDGGGEGTYEGWKGAAAGAIGGGMIGGLPGAALGGLIGYGLGGEPDDPETAFEYGKQAHREGQDIEENPYSEGSENWEAWNEGYSKYKNKDNDDSDNQPLVNPQNKKSSITPNRVTVLDNIDENKPKVLFNPKPVQKGPDDYEYTEFIPRGKEDKTAWAIKRTIDKQKLPQRKPKELNTGFYKNYLGNRPIREADEELSNEVEKFKDWACKKLHIKSPPKIELSMDTEEAQQGHHTGRHVEGSGNIWVYAANRNLVDILRTVFHELVHVRQGELGLIKDGDSYPGSPIEAMADMLAGKYIKIYGKANRKVFQ